MLVRLSSLKTFSISALLMRGRLAAWYRKLEQDRQAELTARQLRRDLRRISALSPHLLSDVGFAEDPIGSGVWQREDCAYTVATGIDTPTPLSGRG